MQKLFGIPENELANVIADIEFEGGRLVSKFKTQDGSWTIIFASAEDPNNEGGGTSDTSTEPDTNGGLPQTAPAGDMDTPDPIPAGPAGKFISARKIANKTIQYIDAAGRDFIREGGSRSWRNFNPGNIRKGSFTISAGAIGNDGSFAIFPDHNTGLEAIATLLRGNSYKNLSLLEAIFRYAPPSENNSGKYINFVENQTGINRQTVLATLNIANIRKIAKAIQSIEGWVKGTERANIPMNQVNAGADGAISSAGASASDWMDIAKRDAALPKHERSEWVDPGENPRILNYFMIAASWFDPVGGDEDNWCAAFVNYCLLTSGYIGTDHPGARSFFWNKKGQFTKLSAPVFGAVAVRRYAPFTDPKWKTGAGHVGFVHSWTSNFVTLLGGNQSKTVRLQKFPLVSKNAAGKVTAEFVAFMMPGNN